MNDTRNDGRLVGHVTDLTRIVDLDGREYRIPIDDVDGSLNDDDKVSFEVDRRHGRRYAVRILYAL